MGGRSQSEQDRCGTERATSLASRDHTIVWWDVAAYFFRPLAVIDASLPLQKPTQHCFCF